jgi:hypothetical protein
MVGEQDETPMEGYGLTDTDMRGATRTNRVRGNPMRGPPLDPTMSPQQKEKYLSGSESPQEKRDRVNLLLQALKRINPDTMLRMDIEKADGGDPFSKAWITLKMGGPMRQLDANPADPQRDMAMQNDMESFYDEAHKEVDDHHKKRQGKRKKLDEMAHRNDKKKVDDWYRDNHPEWFKTFDKE